LLLDGDASAVIIVVALIAETPMSFWYVVIVGIVIFSVLIIQLRSRWYMGCGFALLGAVLLGGIALGIGWFYAISHPPPRPKHDMDWGTLGTGFISLLLIPAVSALVGLVLGIRFAHFLVGKEAETSAGQHRASQRRQS
jgi:hypothetical protein